MNTREDRDSISVLAYVERLLLEVEKRHDERYINQKDYNTYHNNLQREMKDQTKDFPTREAVDAMKERLTRLERWPWLFAGLFTIAVALLKFWP